MHLSSSSVRVCVSEVSARRSPVKPESLPNGSIDEAIVGLGLLQGQEAAIILIEALTLSCRFIL